MAIRHVDVIGGGPGGLFFARLLKLAEPSITVRVHERNGADDTFGFGIVFSDRTMSSLRAADPATCDLISDASVSWSGMEMRVPTATLYYGGYGFTAIARRKLLRILRTQAEKVGVELTFHDRRLIDPTDDPEHVVVLADGVNSAHRTRDADRFGTTVEAGTARYIWLATRASFDGIVFPFVRTPLGAFGAHVYPYGDGLSTFIVEVDETTWRRHGLDEATEVAKAAGRSDDRSRDLLQGVFAEHLDGYPLLTNNSRWDAFRVVRNERWWTQNTVLLGDAAHTAHFSVGSGTKLAMADAIVLAEQLRVAETSTAAFAAYQAARQRPVARTQSLAERSMRWWETFDKRMALPPHRFGMHFLTRTDAIDYAGFHRRHPERMREAEAEFAQLAAGEPVEPPEHALSSTVTLGPLRLPNRVAVPLPDGAGPQLAAAAEAAGAGLVLVDRRGAGQLGATAANGQGLVEVALDADTDHASVRAVVARAGSTSAVCVGIDCPLESAWSAVGGDLVDRCAALGSLGVAGVHLRDPGGKDWEHLLAWSGRIRTEAGLPVLLDGPDGWALRVRRTRSDDWATRLHLALVSGRADVIVAWPLTVPRTH